MMQQRDGFAVLLVLFATSAVMVVGLACWYQSSLAFDVIAQRERYYKNFYDASAALDTGLVLVTKNFDLFFNQLTSKKKSSISLDLGPVLEKNTKITLAIEQFKNKTGDQKQPTLLVQVQLYDAPDAHKSSCDLRCLVIKTGVKIKKEKRGKSDEQYLVQHFTIGNLL